MSVPPVRSAPRRRGARPFTVAAGGLAVLAVLSLLAWVALRAPNGVPLRDYRTIYAEVPDTANLQKHNEVRIAGVRVGQVIHIKAHNGRGRLELKLDPGTEPLPADSKVFLRGKGLLGQRYVELRPGRGSRMVLWGGTVRGGTAALSYGVPDVLETFDRETRGALDEMLGQLGRGMLARGRELNDALDVAPETSAEFRAIEQEILRRPGAARRLIPSLERSAAAFDGGREEIAGSLAPAARALEPFVDRRDAVRSLLDEAPPTLGALQPDLEAGRRLLAATRILATAASDTLPAASSGLRAATRALRESHLPLRRADRLLEALRPAIPAVLRITGRLSPNLDPLRRAFRDAHELTTALAPYSCDIENGADNIRSVIGYPQGPGGSMGPTNAFRATAIAGPEIASPVSTGSDAVERGYRYEPYPAPCKYRERVFDVRTGLPLEDAP